MPLTKHEVGRTSAQMWYINTHSHKVFLQASKSPLFKVSRKEFSIPVVSFLPKTPTPSSHTWSKQTNTIQWYYQRSLNLTVRLTSQYIIYQYFWESLNQYLRSLWTEYYSLNNSEDVFSSQKCSYLSWARCGEGKAWFAEISLKSHV